MDVKTYKSRIISAGGMKIGKRLIWIDKDEEQLYCYREKSDEWQLYQLGDGGTNWLETVPSNEFHKRFGISSK